MSEYSAADSFIFDALTSANLGQAIYNSIVPDNAIYPLTVFQCMSAQDVTVINGYRLFSNMLYQVKSIDTAQSYESADNTADKIDTALNLQFDVTTSSGMVLSCQRVELLSLAQIAGNTEYRSRGGLYRIRITRNQS